MQTLTVAGISLGLQGVDGLGLSPKHALFLTEHERADIHLRLETGPVPREFLEAPLAFDSQGIWRVRHTSNHLLYEFLSPAFEVNPYKSVLVDTEYSEGVLYFSCEGRALNGRTVHPLDIPLEQLILSHHASLHGGVELHCCAVGLGSRAILLCGVSGAGKSTAAQLWMQHVPGARILSDDRAIIKVVGLKAWAHGTPWHGEAGFAAPLALEVAGIFLLEKAPQNEVFRVDPFAALKALYPLTFPPVWSRKAVSLTLETLTQVSQTVPVYRLQCRPEKEAVQIALTSLSI
jgi:hypothetical protein